MRFSPTKKNLRRFKWRDRYFVCRVPRDFIVFTHTHARDTAIKLCVDTAGAIVSVYILNKEYTGLVLNKSLQLAQTIHLYYII